MKKAVITGITGQDGSYLTELLLEKGYEVHGIVRRSSQFNRSRIEHLRDNPDIYDKRLFLHYADLSDLTTLRRIVLKVMPDEFYHLAGQSHVGLSFEIPESTFEETAKSTLGLLEIFRDMERPPRIYHASTSEIFGKAIDSPQNENTPYRPLTPYGCSKVFATQICQVYRDSYEMYVCNGILYNHESPRRSENFVTRKITRTAAMIKLGMADKIILGDLAMKRDWGHAKDYVKAMWLMLQQEQPGDYVVSSGVFHTVEKLGEIAFNHLGLKFMDYYGQNERFIRPGDPVNLIGDPARAKDVLSWAPEYSFEAMIKEMVDFDLADLGGA